MKKHHLFICGVFLYLYSLLAAVSSTPRVAFGNDAAFDQFPSVASLLSVELVEWENSLELTSNCGGSVIANNMILTAAHCIYPNAPLPGSILVGGTSVPTTSTITANASYETNATASYPVTGCLSHPYFHTEGNFSAGTGYILNDIGILFIATPPDNNIPRADILPPKSASLQGQELTYVGFGLTQNQEASPVLQYGYATVPSKPDFKDNPCRSPGIFCTVNTPVPNNETWYQGICRGDSGSPLFIKNTNTQVGIVSFGGGGGDVCGEWTYSGFTNVTFYYNSFILPTMISYAYPDPPPKSSCPTQLKVSLRSNSAYVGKAVPTPENAARKIILSVASAQACGVICRDDPQCYVFNYNKTKKSCYLLKPEYRAKYVRGVPLAKRDIGFTSGYVECALSF